MDRPNLPNPFLTLQSRYLVLGTYLIASVVLGLAYGILGEASLLPRLEDDPISMPILSIAVWTVLAGIILFVGRTRGVNLRYLFGRVSRQLPHISLPSVGLLIASLLIFSLGSFSVVVYFLSLSFPSYAAKMLESNIMLGGGNSSYPQLYDALMLFLLLLYAPFVEELVFRGILLQRWSAKWGLRWGLVASSMLFGLLHVNNPLGLTLFGLVMGLLYVRSRSLWVPIGCHALNNVAAVGLDGLSKVTSSEQPLTVTDFQASWWVGLVLIAVSSPFVMRFIWQSWPKRGDEIPYLTNVGLADDIGLADGNKVG
ncbi:MAG: type II CAAX endopeptidase family protein [Phormidesmis sp.]